MISETLTGIKLKKYWKKIYYELKKLKIMENSGERTQQPATAWKTEKERYEKRLREVGETIAKNYGLVMNVDVSRYNEELSGYITFQEGEDYLFGTDSVRVHFNNDPDIPDYVTSSCKEDGEMVDRMRIDNNALTLGMYMCKYIENMLRIHNEISDKRGN